jgi:hypothetical protein
LQTQSAEHAFSKHRCQKLKCCPFANTVANTLPLRKHSRKHSHKQVGRNAALSQTQSQTHPNTVLICSNTPSNVWLEQMPRNVGLKRVQQHLHNAIPQTLSFANTVANTAKHRSHWPKHRKTWRQDVPKMDPAFTSPRRLHEHTVNTPFSGNLPNTP